MDSEILHQERIEAYLSGKMDLAEKADFEREMAADPHLTEEVGRHRKAHAILRYGLSQKQKARLQQIEHEIGQAHTHRPRRIHFLRRIAAAASVLLIVGLAATIWINQAYDHHALAERLFMPAPEETFRDRGDYVNTLGQRFEQAQILFEQGRYEEARQLYLEIIKEDSLLKGQAEWNLLMCYLATDPESPQFGILFNRISGDSSHDFYHQALDLREKMSGTLYLLAN